MSASTDSTSASCSRRPSSPAEASPTSRMRSPASVSSSVAANASTSPCGSLRMNPTVSVTRYARPSSRNARVVGSSVSKSRSSTRTSEPVRAFRSVDLPTFVYPARATVGIALRVRSRRMTLAPIGHRLEPCLEERDLAAGDPPVGLELGLARAACADAASQPLEVLPHAAHALHRVLELGELDLELALGGVGVLGEDVEDDGRAVDDPHLERVLERPLLAGRELVVAGDHLGLGLLHQVAELVDLAGAEVRPRIRPAPVLGERRHRVDGRRAKQLLHLGEHVLVVGAGRQGGDDDAPLGRRLAGGAAGG